jgi:hypothetical protein
MELASRRLSGPYIFEVAARFFESCEPLLLMIVKLRDTDEV